MEYQPAFTRRDFILEFKISKFKDSPISIPEDQLVLGTDSGVCVSVRGSGVRPENKGFIVFRMEKYFDVPFLRYGKSYPPTFNCSCILSVLDTEGQKKFPRTYTLENDSECSGVYEERYIERSSILNNAPEYLQEETITITVEGSLLILFEYHAVEKLWLSSGNLQGFKVEQLEQGLKVCLCDFYLLKHSEISQDVWDISLRETRENFQKKFKIQLEQSLKVSLCDFSRNYYLRKYSKVFQDVWSVSMRETTKSFIILKNKELPSFLCILLFIETENLVLHEVMIPDLYKLAYKYDIPILLQECRKHIAKYLPKNASSILEFATYYHDVDLKRIAEAYMESHSHELRERDDDLEEEGEWGDDFACDTLPVCGSLIKKKEDFEECLRILGESCKCPIPEEYLEYKFLLLIPDEPNPFDFYQ